MSALDLREEIRQRRLDRMRLGKAAADYTELISDPEIRLALVPLTDHEAEAALIAAANIDVPDNVAGLMARDHRQKVELLVCSLRDPQDLDKRIYRHAQELQTELDEADVNHLYDVFTQMQENSNPTLEGIDPEEFEVLKKALQEIPWNELSGRSWYAAKRFLGALIRDGLLRDSFSGSISSTKLTTENE